MAATRRIVKGHGGGFAYVQSQTDPRKWYRITEDGVCECLDYFYRNKQIRACKHAYAVVAKEGYITQ
jgi:hypothetical protein